jgi:hypothetical protein
MSQVIFRVNLQNQSFPLLSGLMGRSVVIPNQDMTEKSKTQSNVQDGNQYLATPQIMYAENVMPTAQGYKSTGFTIVVNPPIGAPVSSMEYVFSVRDIEERKALIGFHYASGNLHVFILTAVTGVWTYITSIALSTFVSITAANADGIPYFCVAGKGIYTVDLVALTFTAATLTYPALTTAASFYAICSSNNYLLLADKYTVYWSSATDSTDFTASLITGSGSGTPNDLAGDIITLSALNNGFVVYSSSNIILSSYSGNSQYPWIFRNANNGAGIYEADNVTTGTDLGTHYAWTSAGLLKITAQGCETIFPEITDYISSGMYETSNWVGTPLGYPVLVNRGTAGRVKIVYIGSRYLCISYSDAVTPNEYIHSLVYDFALKRWGKFNITHVSVFEPDLNLVSPGVVTNAAAISKHTICVMNSVGRIFYVDFASTNGTQASRLIFGRFQLTRTSLLSLLQTEVEARLPGNTAGIGLTARSSLDGKDAYLATKLTSKETSETESFQVYTFPSRVTGKNHLLDVTGMFELVSVVVTCKNQGRR